MSWKEPCQKCRGSGKFRSYSGRIVGQCLACKGAGFKSYRSSPEARAKGRAAVEKTKARKAEELNAQVAAWMAEHREEAKWIVQRKENFGFAQAMYDALWKYGALTERQMDTVQRLCAADKVREAERAQAKAQREASAPEVTVEKVEEAFASAKAAGLKSLRLRLAGFVFSPAPAHGVNAGAIYVKRGEDYLGKIAQGRFFRARACEEVTEAEIVKVVSDPKGEAIAYGRRTGSCACCGRELTNHASIELGIGPICAEKWGW